MEYPERRSTNRVPEAVYQFWMSDPVLSKNAPFKIVKIKSGPNKGKKMYYLITEKKKPKKRAPRIKPCTKGKVRAGPVGKNGLKRCILE